MKIKEYIKAIKKDSLYKCEFPEDVERIVKVMKTIDIDIIPQEAELMWSLYSEKYFAQWLVLPKEDKEIMQIIIDTAIEKYYLLDD